MPSNYKSRSAFRKVADIDFTAVATADYSGGSASITMGTLTASTVNEGVATTLDALLGTGVRIGPDTTDTAAGRPGSFTCPGFKFDDLFAQLPGDNIRGIAGLLHLDNSSANAAREMAGICIHDVAQSQIALTGMVGTTAAGVYAFHGWRDTNETDVAGLVAADAGVNAVIGFDFTMAGCNFYIGSSTNGKVRFADLTLHASLSGNRNATTGALNAEIDLYLVAEPGNVSGNLTSVFKRLELYYLQAALP